MAEFTSAQNVERAAKFLAHPRIAQAPLEKRIAFLRSQEIPERDIEAACHAVFRRVNSEKKESAAKADKKKRKKKKKDDVEPIDPAPGTSGFGCMFCST